MKVLTVGREATNDIVIQDVKVSRVHLQIAQKDNGVCSVIDLGSTNGTYVNGRRITGEVILSPTDTIRIGHTMLPWQDYIKPTKGVAHGGNDNPRKPSKRGRQVFYVVVGALLLVIVCGGAGWYIYHNNQKQKEKELQEAILQKEKKSADDEEQLNASDRLLFEVAQERDDAKEQIEKQKEQIEKQIKERNNAEQKIENLQKDTTEKAKYLKDAEERAAKAEKAKRATEENANKKVKKVEEEMNAVKAEAKNATNAAKDANEKAELITKFSKLINSNTDKFAQQVCEKLGDKGVKEREAKERLFTKFDNAADNKKRAEIIKKIEEVKKNNDDERKKLEKSFETECKSLTEPVATAVLQQLNKPVVAGNAITSLKKVFEEAENEDMQPIIDKIKAEKAAAEKAKKEAEAKNKKESDKAVTGAGGDADAVNTDATTQTAPTAEQAANSNDTKGK